MLEPQEINGLIVWKKSTTVPGRLLRARAYSAGVGRIFGIYISQQFQFCQVTCEVLSLNGS